MVAEIGLFIITTVIVIIIVITIVILTRIAIIIVTAAVDTIICNHALSHLHTINMNEKIVPIRMIIALPDPVCPYEKIHTLNPSSAD